MNNVIKFLRYVALHRTITTRNDYEDKAYLPIPLPGGPNDALCSKDEVDSDVEITLTFHVQDNELMICSHVLSFQWFVPLISLST